MKDAVRKHCAELDRCNQRGGRMLSIFDLLEAGTVDIELAARLMARITRGASFMVGAQPGGAGKTTVMCALLNLVPPDCTLAAATPEAVRAAGDNPPAPRTCFICHEIGAGHWFAYLWGGDLRRYCALQDHGHLLATNLHADTLEEAHAQVVRENRVPEQHFTGFDLLLFLRVGGGFGRRQRIIQTVYQANGSGHNLVFNAQGPVQNPFDANDDWTARCRQFLETHYDTGCRTIEDSRRRVLEFLAGE